MNVQTGEITRAIVMANILKNCGGDPHWIDLVNQWALTAGIIEDDELITDDTTFIQKCWLYGITSHDRSHYGDIPLVLLNQMLSKLEPEYDDVSMSSIVDTYVQFMVDNRGWLGC